MANEFKIKNGLIVSGSVDIEQGLTVRGTLTTDELSGDVDYSNIINAPTLVSGSSQISFNGITDKPTLVSGSSQILNSSGVWSGSAQLPNGIISGSEQLPDDIISSSIQLDTLGYATTGSNDFIGTQTITGSLYISQNLVVQGSSSLENITGSNVYIGTNKINLNTDTPSIRFGGVSVFDSGSNFGESGSLLWDSQANHWIYQHPSSSGAPYGSAMLISGPKNSGSLGDEQGLTTGKISKAVGDDHIGDSIITETGGGIGIGGALSVTGSLTSTGTQTNRGVVIDGANNGNVATLSLTRTDTSWGINNETDLRIYSANSNTTSPDTLRVALTSNGNLGIGTSTPTALLHLSGASPYIFLDDTSTTGTKNRFQIITGDVGVTQSGIFSFNNVSGTSLTDVLTINELSRVGIGTTSPNVKLEVLDTATTSGEVARFQRNLDQINEYAYIRIGNSSYPGYFGSMLGTYDIAYMSMSPNPTDGKAICIRTTDGNVGIGTTNPSQKLEVYSSGDTVLKIKSASATGTARLLINPEGAGAGSTGDASIFFDCNTTAWVAGVDKSDSSKFKISNDVYGDFSTNNYFTITTAGRVGVGTVSPTKLFEVNGRMGANAIVSGNIIAGNIAANIDSSPSYILICDLNNDAGFSMSGKVNAASYTCWNISDIWIKKDYTSTVSAAGITGSYKSGCDFSIVDINYASSRYIAFRFTGNPEIDIMCTGYRLNSMFNSDGSAQVVPAANVSVNSTLASY